MDSNSIFIVGDAYSTYQIFKLMIDTLELTKKISADTASEYKQLCVKSLLHVIPLNKNIKIGVIAIVETAIPKIESGKRLNFLRLAVFESTRGSNLSAKEKQVFQLTSCPSTLDPKQRLMIGQLLNGTNCVAQSRPRHWMCSSWSALAACNNFHRSHSELSNSRSRLLSSMACRFCSLTLEVTPIILRPLQ